MKEWGLSLSKRSFSPGEKRMEGKRVHRIDGQTKETSKKAQPIFLWSYFSELFAHICVPFQRMRTRTPPDEKEREKEEDKKSI